MKPTAHGGSRRYWVNRTGTIEYAIAAITQIAVSSVRGECGSSWQATATDGPPMYRSPRARTIASWSGRTASSESRVMLPPVLQEGPVAVPVQVRDLSGCSTRRGPVAAPRPAERYDGARLHAPGQAEGAAGEEGAPDRQRDQRGAEAGGARGEQQVLHRGGDRSVVARCGHRRPVQAGPPQARDDHDRDLLEWIALPEEIGRGSGRGR